MTTNREEEEETTLGIIYLSIAYMGFADEIRFAAHSHSDSQPMKRQKSGENMLAKY